MNQEVRVCLLCGNTDPGELTTNGVGTYCWPWCCNDEEETDE